MSSALLEPSRHSIGALTYRLIEGPVSLEPLRILAQRAFPWADCQVTVFILGASHAITIERNGRLFTELLTCAPPAGDAATLVEADPTIRNHLRTPVAGVNCDVRFAIEPHHPTSGVHISTRSHQDEIAVPFPDSGGASAAETWVGWTVEGLELTVETLHTYPEERSKIRSCTTFRAEAAR